MLEAAWAVSRRLRLDYWKSNCPRFTGVGIVREAQALARACRERFAAGLPAGLDSFSISLVK